jgi:hypothetical protein
VPYLRGYGATRFSDDTVRNGQQAVLAVDAILLDALDIESAIVGGFDWARTATCGRAVARALQGDGLGERHLIGTRLPTRRRFRRPPVVVVVRVLFATNAVRPGTTSTGDFAKLIWHGVTEVGVRRHDVRAQRRVRRADHAAS